MQQGRRSVKTDMEDQSESCLIGKVPHESSQIVSDNDSDRLAEICTVGGWLSWAQEKKWSQLEAVLPGYLKRRRWFGGKTRSIRSVHIADALTISDSDAPTFFVVDVSYDDGAGDSYYLPLVFIEGRDADSLLACDPGEVVAKVSLAGKDRLRIGVVVDGFRSHEFCRSLFGLIEQCRAVGSESGRLRARLASWICKEEAFPVLEPRVIGSEQSNTSVIWGERYILKMFRRSTAGRNPELETGLFLTERSEFANAPRVVAWLEYCPDKEASRVVAVVHEYLPATQDAWAFTREELKRFFNRVPVATAAPKFGGLLADLLRKDPVGPAVNATFLVFAELLGCRTAQLHLALANDFENEAFAPEPYEDEYQRADSQSMLDLAQETLRQLRLSLDSLPADLASQVSKLLAKEKQVFACLEEFRRQKLHFFRIRSHGDYHLGQVLYTGEDFFIIDFEGEPARTPAERLRKGSALRDVASMIRSFHYAAQSTLLEQIGYDSGSATDWNHLENWAEFWYHEVARAFLRGYVKTADGASFLPENQDELSGLLQVFLLEKALYEIGYELNNRPSWLRIPLRGICGLEMSGFRNASRF